MTSNGPPDITQALQQSWEDWTHAWAGLIQPAQEGDKPAPTPTEAWKRSTDRWLGAWSTYLEQAMSTPEFAQSFGQTLDRTLNVQKPLREQTSEATQRLLQAANMPSRQDITRLARQVNDVNERLDEMSDRLEQIGDMLAMLVAERGGNGVTKASLKEAERAWVGAGSSRS